MAYIRVSTDSDEQAGSYETQENHFRDVISKHEDWIFTGVYGDDYDIIGRNQGKPRIARGSLI